MHVWMRVQVRDMTISNDILIFTTTTISYISQLKIVMPQQRVARSCHKFTFIISCTGCKAASGGSSVFGSG